MAVKTREQHELDQAVAFLDQLLAFGDGSLEMPPMVTGLTPAGVLLLEQPGGRDIVATWAEVFRDTIDLVKQFHTDNMQRPRPPSPEEIDKVESVARGTIQALVERVNRLAQRRQV